MAFRSDRRRAGAGGPQGLRRTMAEINIIPLVDVVLVLLIIFMLTAHVMEFGLEVDVPKVTQIQNNPSKNCRVVSLDKRGEIYIGEKRANNIATLVAEVKQRYPNAKAVFSARRQEHHRGTRCSRPSRSSEPAKLQVRLVTQPDDGK